MRLNRSTITNNRTGVAPLNNADIRSYGNNVIHGNRTSGDPTATIPLK